MCARVTYQVAEPEDVSASLSISMQDSNPRKSLLKRLGTVQSWLSSLALQVAEPEDACANLTVPVLDSKPWIALIKRSERARTDCSFDIKVGGPMGLLQGTHVVPAGT